MFAAATAFAIPLFMIIALVAVVFLVRWITKVQSEQRPDNWSRDAARLLDRLQTDDMVRPMLNEYQKGEVDRLLTQYYRRRN